MNGAATQSQIDYINALRGKQTSYLAENHTTTPEQFADLLRTLATGEGMHRAGQTARMVWTCWVGTGRHMMEQGAEMVEVEAAWVGHIEQMVSDLTIDLNTLTKAEASALIGRIG